MQPFTRVADFEDAEIYLNDTYQVAKRSLGTGEMGPLFHLSIKRIDRSPIHDWREMQLIKNAITHQEAEGIEIYPAESRLVDTSNQYHMFVFTEYRLPFGFEERRVSEAELNNSKQRPWSPDEKPPDLMTQEQQHVWVAEALDGTTVLKGTGIYSKCPRCYKRVGDTHLSTCKEALMQRQAKKRPENFTSLTVREQWAVDKALGILDWDGY